MTCLAARTVASASMATMSVRGVITSPTGTSPRRITFDTTRHSSSSIVPVVRAISAITSISSRLIPGRFPDPCTSRCSHDRGTSRGVMVNVSALNT